MIKLLRKNNITIRGFLRIYPELFAVRNGVVKLKTQPLAPEPAAPEPVAPEPAAPARRRLTLIGGDDASVQARLAEAQRLQGRLEEEEARRRRANARVRGIQGVYGERPL